MGDSVSGQTGGTAPRRGRPISPGSSVLTPPDGMPALSTPPGLGASIPAQRRPDDHRPAPPPAAVVDPCVCGHGRAAHEHFRPGHDCGACGAAGCAEFRADDGPVRRMLRRLGLAS